MRAELPKYRKPGAFQQGFVLTVCILVLVGMAYLGTLFWVDEQASENILRWIEEIKG